MGRWDPIGLKCPNFLVLFLIKLGQVIEIIIETHF